MGPAVGAGVASGGGLAVGLSVGLAAGVSVGLAAGVTAGPSVGAGSGDAVGTAVGAGVASGGGGGDGSAETLGDAVGEGSRLASSALAGETMEVNASRKPTSRDPAITAAWGRRRRDRPLPRRDRPVVVFIGSSLGLSVR
jgi:hypothetical protein